jgi:chromate transporter
LHGSASPGPAGAALALLAMLLPSALAILALDVLYFGYGVGPGLESALRGTGAAVVGIQGWLTADSAWTATPSLRSPPVLPCW